MGVWLWLPLAGPIRTSTVVAALVLVSFISIQRLDPLLALVTTLAWASAFEILYNVVGVLGFHWSLGPFAWQTAALLGWVVRAAVLRIWPDWRVVGGFALLMAV